MKIKKPQPYVGMKNWRIRRNQEEEDEEGRDSLSCLPDSILAHILSFIDTRSSVATSVLSKRYKQLWTLSPSLYFKLYEPVPYHPRGSCVYIPDDSGVVFESFVCNVLLRREHSNVETFRLSLHNYVTSDFVRHCIDYAAQHKVQNLRVRALGPLHKCGPVILPDALCTCSSLVTLQLHNATANIIELPKSVLWPNLRVFHLKNFEFSEHLGGEVFTGCPGLQSLVLCKCSIRPGNKLTSLKVNCLNLESLEVTHWRSPWRCFDEHMIHVNAPRLASFKLKGHLVRIFFGQGCPCLEQVYVDLWSPTACLGVNLRERKEKTCESFLWMLRQLCRIRLLALSLKTIEVLCTLSHLEPIIFENLRLIKFTTEKKLRERMICVEHVVQLLNAATDVVILYGFTEKQISPGKRKRQNDAPLSIPANVIHFLLESSPCAEYLCIEIPEVMNAFFSLALYSLWQLDTSEEIEVLLTTGSK